MRFGDWVKGTGHGEMGEVRSRRMKDGAEIMEGVGMRTLGEVNADELYKYLAYRLHTGKMVNIPYRTVISQRNYPKWITGRLKHYTGLKRSIYKRLKAEEEDLRPQYNELVRRVRKLTKKAKNNYKLQTKTDPKGFYQGYRTKNKEIIDSLKASNGELVLSGEERRKVLNEYFLTVPALFHVFS